MSIDDKTLTSGQQLVLNDLLEGFWDGKRLGISKDVLKGVYSQTIQLVEFYSCQGYDVSAYRTGVQEMREYLKGV